MKNILKEIETKYPVDTILVNGEQVWPYLRLACYFEHVHKAASEMGEKYPFPPFAKRLLNMAKNSLYGFNNWFGKYDYVVLSNTLERRSLGGKYFNKLLDPIIDKLGRDKVLYIEASAPSLYPIKEVYTKNIVCLDLLTLVGVVLEVFKPRRYVIKNESVLEGIQKAYGLGLDYIKEIKFFNARRRGFDLLFRKVKPKALLLSNYGGCMPAIKSAKDLGIKVIELQHGTMGKEYAVYNIDAEVDKSYFPDYLLVFGRNDRKIFDNSCFIEPENVIPIGSFYIEHVKKNHKPDLDLVKQMSNYRLSVGVALEWTTEKHVIEFICQAANLDKTVLYILIPRIHPPEHYSTMSLPDNVMVIKGKDFYEIMMYVDFHSTVYSTCALEAPSFGVRNILINIENLSKQYYGNVLQDSRITRYADTPAQFVEIIDTFETLDRDTICRLNEDIIATNYAENIQDFIKGHMKS